MSAPTLSEDRAVGPPERLHPLFLLQGLGGSVRRVGGLYAILGYLVVSGQLELALLAAALFLLLGVIGALIYWTRFEYRVGENEIRIDSGILSRRHRSIPFDRIQDVDITQGPVARLLGLAEVRFETGGGGNDAEEGVLQAIAIGRAHELRGLIRSHHASGGPVDGGSEAEQPQVYAMSGRRLLAAGTFNFSLAVFAGLIGVTQTFGDVLGFDPLNRRFWMSMLSAENPVAHYVLLYKVPAAIAGALLLMAIGFLTGIVRTTLRDWGFRLDRAGAGLRRRRGLLTRTDVTLPLKRAQAALVTSGPVRSAFGFSQLYLKNLAADQGGGAAHVLAPLACRDEIDRILSELGWRPIPPQPQWRYVSTAYVWVFVLALSPLLLPIAVQAAVAWPIAAVGAATVAAIVAFRWLSWVRTAYALDGDRVLIRTGWWRRRLLVLPHARIQSADITQNFISRWFGTATLRFGVAGGSLAGEIIPAIPSDTARQLRGELLSLSA